MKRLSSIAPAVAATIVCIALRLAALPTVSTPGTDDVVSYQEATCHWAESRAMISTGSPPVAHWASAADWQRLWTPDDRFCFERIARDLGTSDIHPPLYFWLLHLWLMAFGVSAQSGPALNVLLSCVTAMLVFALGRAIGASARAATAGVLVWGLSDATITIALLTRSYELLALLGTAFTLLVSRASDPDRLPPRWVLYLLAATSAAGMLTHYHFALLLVAATLAAGWRLRRSPRQRRLNLAALIAAGAISALLLHPHALAAFRRAPSAGPLRHGDPFYRAVRVEKTLENAGGPRIVKIFWVGALGAAAASLVVARGRRSSDPESSVDETAVRSLAAIVAMLATATAALYVTFVTPSHAMGPRYMSTIWPLLAVVVAATVWRTRPGRWLVSALCVALLVGSGSRVRTGLQVAEQRKVTLDPRRPVLVDNDWLGVVPMVLWNLPPQTRVFAASQSHLLQHQADWLDALGDEPVYAATSTANRQAGRDRMLRLLGSRYQEAGDRQHSRNTEWISLRRLDGAGDPAPVDGAGR